MVTLEFDHRASEKVRTGYFLKKKEIINYPDLRRWEPTASRGQQLVPGAGGKDRK